MKLFSKKTTSSSCTCNTACTNENMYEAEVSKSVKGIKVLGSGCAKCRKLEASVVEALNQLGIETVVEHITDYAQMASYGVMSTPALVIHNKMVSYGKVLSVEEAKKLIEVNY